MQIRHLPPPTRGNGMIRRAQWVMLALAFSTSAFILQATELYNFPKLDVIGPSREAMTISLPATPRFYAGNHFVPSLQFNDAEPYDPPHAGSMDEDDADNHNDTDEFQPGPCVPLKDLEWNWNRYASKGPEAEVESQVETSHSDMVDMIPASDLMLTRVGSSLHEKEEDSQAAVQVTTEGNAVKDNTGANTKNTEEDAEEGPKANETFEDSVESKSINKKSLRGSHKSEDKLEKSKLAESTAVSMARRRLSAEPEFTASKRLLIGLFSGFDNYANILSVTSQVNKAYAKRWSHDIVVLQGSAMPLRTEEVDGETISCTPPGSHTTLNKIRLLLHAIERKESYDQLLLLDADAVMYDLNFDVTTLLPSKYLLAAHKVHESSSSQTHDVNTGVTLWNLHHALAKPVALEWFERSRQAVSNRAYHGDQRHLQLVLKKNEEFTNSVRALSDGSFAYGHGTVVQHYIRKEHRRNFDDPRVLDGRLGRMEETVKEVCEKFAPACEGIEQGEFATE